MEDHDLKMRRLHLFPTPTFWAGIGSLIDVYGALSIYNSSPSAAKADYDALRSDWLAVGDSIAAAINIESEKMKRNR